MIQTVGLVYAAFAAFAVLALVRSRSPLGHVLAVLITIAVAYYTLPLVFYKRSGLESFDSSDVLSAFAIHATYLAIACVIAWVVGQRLGRYRGFSAKLFDNTMERAPLILGATGGILNCSWLATTQFSLYQASSFDEHFNATLNGGFGIVGALAALGLSLNAFYAAERWIAGRRLQAAALFVLIGTATALSWVGVQRLAIATPILTVAFSFVALRKPKLGAMLVGGGAVALLIASPLIVMAREGPTGRAAISEQGEMSLERRLDEGLTSIVQRADLIENTITLKRYFDENGYVDGRFYWSVLATPIPRLLYPDKPIPLSADGNRETEISALAWSIRLTGTGSLTAFGGITAYRQGEWPALVLDAIAMGVLLGIVGTWLLNGGHLGKVIFVTHAVAFSLRKAPPSFFEALQFSLTFAPFALALWFVSVTYPTRRATVRPRLNR